MWGLPAMTLDTDHVHHVDDQQDPNQRQVSNLLMDRRHICGNMLLTKRQVERACYAKKR